MVSSPYGIQQLMLQYFLPVNLSSTTIHLGQKYMSYSRFVQIGVAFHPESGTSQEQDECHPLRNAINHLNKAAKRTFIPGKEISLDEGGIASKSSYNTVRQYDNSKPDKYRINFFIFANASSRHNFIYHIDVHQKKQTNKTLKLPKIFGISP